MTDSVDIVDNKLPGHSYPAQATRFHWEVLSNHRILKLLFEGLCHDFLMESCSLILDEFVHEELLVRGIVVDLTVVSGALSFNEFFEFLRINSHKPNLLVYIEQKVTNQVSLKQYIL